jgi:hypothetical protein
MGDLFMISCKKKLETLLENTDQPWIYTPPNIPLDSRKTDPQELLDTLFRLTGISVVTKEISNTHNATTLPPQNDGSGTFFFDEFDEPEQKQSENTLSNQNSNTTESRETFNFLLEEDIDEPKNLQEEVNQELEEEIDTTVKHDNDIEVPKYSPVSREQKSYFYIKYFIIGIFILGLGLVLFLFLSKEDSSPVEESVDISSEETDEKPNDYDIKGAKTLLGALGPTSGNMPNVQSSGGSVRVERFPNIEGTECPIQGTPFDLSVWFSEEGGEHVAQIQSGPQKKGKLEMTFTKPGPWEITVTLMAAGFDIEGMPTKTFYLPVAGDSKKAKFKLTPKNSGEQTVFAVFNNDEGKMLGIAAKVFDISEKGILNRISGSFCDTSTTITPQIALSSNTPPDITLFVQEDSKTETAHLHISSPYFLDRIQQQHEVDLKAIRTQIHSSITNRSTPLTEKALNRFGRELFAKISTPQLREILKSVRNRSKKNPKILIVTNAHDIPFEMILPKEVDNPNAKFLGTDFIVSRSNLGSSNSLLSLAPPQKIHIASGDQAFFLSSSTQSKESLTEFHQVVSKYQMENTADINSENLRLFHISNSENPSQDDQQVTLETLVTVVEESESFALIFVNQHDSNNSSSSVHNWGAQLLEVGAGGVVISRFNKLSNSHFWKHFYQELQIHGHVGEALRNTRAQYYKTGDATFLNYVFYGDPNLKLMQGESKDNEE